jgi:hypothetical protein
LELRENPILPWEAYVCCWSGKFYNKQQKVLFLKGDIAMTVVEIQIRSSEV